MDRHEDLGLDGLVDKRMSQVSAQPASVEEIVRTVGLWRERFYSYHDGDRDWFAVELEAGRTYRFDLEGSPTDAGTLSDPYLRGIHDAEGNLIAGTMDNNRGEGRNARETFTATDDGTYYVSAGAWSDRTGTYTLKVTDITARTATSNHLGTYELEAPAPRAPSFAETGYAFDLAENANGSTTPVALGKVSASDPEGTAVTYSIAGGNESGRFVIDAATGALSYTGAGEDYESETASYALTVRASDGSLHADATVTANVTDVDDEAPASPVLDAEEHEEDAVPLPTLSGGGQGSCERYRYRRPYQGRRVGDGRDPVSAGRALLGAEVQRVRTKETTMKETTMETKQYSVTAERAMSDDPGLPAGVEMTNLITGRDHAARVAVDRAKDEEEPMVITASHWPKTPLGDGEHNRLFAIRVCPGDAYDDVRAQINKCEAD